MYNPAHMIEILADNVRATMNPFGIPKSLINGWWKDQPLDRDGEALLATGLMYQFLPYIETVSRWLERFEDAGRAAWLPYARFAPQWISGVVLGLLGASAEARRRAAQPLRDIVAILRKSGQSVAYRPELDEYSGVLLYDLGDQEGFVRHARRVAAKLQKAGIRKIVTVDPHTTYALKVLYPKYVGASFEVRTYFEGLSLSGDRAGEKLIKHDPCFYGRYLELSDAPRRVLGDLGYQCQDLRESGTYTSCCGGPAESLSPKLAAQIGTRRVETLAAAGGRLVAMCPICRNNLEKNGAKVVDLSAVLAESL